MADSLKTIVKRSEWNRGKRGGSRLLCPNGTMCCLGFRSAQAGVPRSRLFNSALPPPDEWRTWMRRAININDATEIPDEKREAKLIEIFREAGEEIVFVD